MPISNTILNLFGPSPFKPLQEHMRVVVQCASNVPDLFEALCDDDTEKMKKIRDQIFNELRSHLPRSIFMPVDRRDLLEILDLQDTIADTAQDIAGMLMIRRPKALESIRGPLMDLTNRCLDACNQMAAIMEHLDELVETGFRGPESDVVVVMIGELNRIETDTDQKGMEVLRQLFAHEDEIDPVSLMVWRRLIHWVGDLANYSEKVGNRLRLLVAH
jgi:predicted phosphate transport protein (TIGR00153 family)